MIRVGMLSYRLVTGLTMVWRPQGQLSSVQVVLFNSTTLWLVFDVLNSWHRATVQLSLLFTWVLENTFKKEEWAEEKEKEEAIAIVGEVLTSGAEAQGTGWLIDGLTRWPDDEDLQQSKHDLTMNSEIHQKSYDDVIWIPVGPASCWCRPSDQLVGGGKLCFAILSSFFLHNFNIICCFSHIIHVAKQISFMMHFARFELIVSALLLVVKKTSQVGKRQLEMEGMTAREVASS